MKQDLFTENIIITAGSTYLDIDAYACCVAMRELLELKGQRAIAFSNAPSNYSVCESLIEDGQLLQKLPVGVSAQNASYIIVDVSDPDFIRDSVPLCNVVEVYDHHVGFEEYWQSRIGEKSHIEFIGAAATLIFREWEVCGMLEKMTRATALLLIAAILDNTLNLTSSNTTGEDIRAFNELCKRENVGEEWCASYFSEVQSKVEADLKNALFGDIKRVGNNCSLPARVAQLCVWDAQKIIKRLPEIRQWFENSEDSWMINIIDIKQRCSYFVCEDSYYQKELESVFEVRFESGVARTIKAYLRKEIIKKTYQHK